jgi:hypothetical protein
MGASISSLEDQLSSSFSGLAVTKIVSFSFHEVRFEKKDSESVESPPPVKKSEQLTYSGLLFSSCRFHCGVNETRKRLKLVVFFYTCVSHHSIFFFFLKNF